MSADLSGKKRRPITADFQIWKVHFGPWEISRLTLKLQNRSERSHERWRPDSFRTNYSVNSQAFVLVVTLRIALKIITSESKFAERNTLQSLYVCVWVVSTLTSTAPIGSSIICMWSPAGICEQWERNFIFQFSRRSWGRNVWRTSKNVCVGG